MSIIILSPPPPPPPPGGRAEGEAPDKIIPTDDGYVMALFDGPKAAARARKYLKALEE